MPRKFQIQRAIQDEVDKRKSHPPRWQKVDGEEPFEVLVWTTNTSWGVLVGAVDGVTPDFSVVRGIRFTLTPRTSYDETKGIAAQAYLYLNDKQATC